MRSREFLAERWTPRTVKDYFDSQHNNRISRKDFQITQPFDGCVMFRFRTIPDLTRAFFRMAEYHEGSRYRGTRPRAVTMSDFLDRFVDRQGQVDYFRFWDGFNITDRSFRAWLKSAGDLAQGEQIIVDEIKRRTGAAPFCIVGVAGDDPATQDHEIMHAMYHLKPDYRRAVDDLMDQFRTRSEYRTMKRVLKDRLQYGDHFDEEIAAYLTAGTQLGMVFGVNPRDWGRKFKALLHDHRPT